MQAIHLVLILIDREEKPKEKWKQYIFFAIP